MNIKLNEETISVKIRNCFTAMVTAIYAALTLSSSFFSFRVIQYRIAEGLTILPYFASFLIPGLLIGCTFSNINKSTRYYGYGFWFLATFIAWNCIATYLCY